LRPKDAPLTVDGALIQKPAEKPAGALDESLLGGALAKKPRGISQSASGIAPASRISVTPKSPRETAQWFEKFLAAFAPRAPAQS